MNIQYSHSSKRYHLLGVTKHSHVYPQFQLRYLFSHYSMLPQPNNDFTNIYRVSRFFTNSVLQSLPTPWSPYYLYIYRIDVSFGFPDSFRHVGGLIQHCSISLSILTIFVQLRLNDEPLFVVSLESIITQSNPSISELTPTLEHTCFRFCSLFIPQH